MNKVVLMGRLVRDAEVRYSQGGDKQMAIARFTMAVDRRVKANNNSNQPTADFIGCVAFGKAAEFYERFGRKGTKFLIEGRIQTGSYDKDGQKVYTTDIVVESTEFAESKNSSGASSSTGSAAPAAPEPTPSAVGDGFMNIPDGIKEELPFN